MKYHELWPPRVIKSELWSRNLRELASLSPLLSSSRAMAPPQLSVANLCTTPSASECNTNSSESSPLAQETNVRTGLNDTMSFSSGQNVVSHVVHSVVRVEFAHTSSFDFGTQCVGDATGFVVDQHRGYVIHVSVLPLHGADSGADKSI